ncbi:MAG TPA: InlB B-repeat-containing protein [Clostridiaceae bacterium]|nr:InlB B-repeat-containing protein [Clostridiaceae bacterium]
MKRKQDGRSCGTIYESLTFNSKGGSTISPIENVEHGSKITAPQAPTRLGYSFVGWY